jgi:hypothetical protein
VHHHSQGNENEKNSHFQVSFLHTPTNSTLENASTDPERLDHRRERIPEFLSQWSLPPLHRTHTTRQHLQPTATDMRTQSLHLEHLSFLIIFLPFAPIHITSHLFPSPLYFRQTGDFLDISLFIDGTLYKFPALTVVE